MEQIKNILILSTQDPYKSSGVGAYGIFKNLKKEKDYNVRLLIESYNPKYEDGIICIKSGFDNRLTKLKNKILKRIKKEKSVETNPDFHFHLNKVEYSSHRILNKINFKPDIIIVFFAQNFISYENLNYLQKTTQAPIIWQFADMRPFTGGCHYAWECDGYKNFCELCPALVINNEKNFPYIEMKKNFKIMENLNITAVIGSDWLIDRAKQSNLFRDKKIKKIFLSLDSSFFKPLANKKKLKEKYRISINKKIILIAAFSLNHKRKGVSLIFESLDVLRERNEALAENIEIFIVGHDLDKIKHILPKGYSYVHSEYIERKYLPEIYDVADIFVSASLQDVGPYTIAESLLCETPVVSFDTGYANDFVNDFTGVLVNDISVKSLAVGIEKLLTYDNTKMKEIGKKGREIVIKTASEENQLREYKKLITQLLHE